MVSREEIQATCNDIVREFAPLQIILFGSYAYGTPTDYSDVDLLVVMLVEKSEARAQADEIRDRIPSRFKMDLLVRSPEYIAYRISYNDWFLREIIEKGLVLYESDGFYIIPYKKENTDMNPLTLEWIEKAEGEFIAAVQVLYGSNPITHVLCLLAQQCVEKYLKAWLQENNIPFQRTHDLEELLNLILPSMPAWGAWQPGLSKLTEHAADSRYPQTIATASDAENAMRICGDVRDAIHTYLKVSKEENNT